MRREEMNRVNRSEIMTNPSVHNLTKHVLELAQGKDVVDAYYDVLLAAKVLATEMDTALGVTDTKEGMP